MNDEMNKLKKVINFQSGIAFLCGALFCTTMVLTFNNAIGMTQIMLMIVTSIFVLVFEITRCTTSERLDVIELNNAKTNLTNGDLYEPQNSQTKVV